MTQPAPSNTLFLPNTTGNMIFLSSRVVAILFCISAVLVLFTSYEGWVEKPAMFRVTISALCFFTILGISAFNSRFGLMACIFALPLLPTATTQIQAFTGYGRIFPIYSPGFDVVVGFSIGIVINKLFTRDKSKLFYFPWPLLLLLAGILISTSLAIARNLHQTQSSFQSAALIYNLLHFRTIGWHDDYRPLFDCIAYICGIGFIAILVPLLQRAGDRNELIFRPLIASTLIAVFVGAVQSQTARGLTEWQAWYFRHDSLGFIALGMQPDIHAFAGQMMLGAVGLFGFLYAARSLSDRLAIMFTLPLAWAALVLSKSKSSVALALLLILVIALVWWYRHHKKMLKAIAILLLMILVFLMSAYALKSLLLPLLNELLLKLGLGDLSSINIKMAYRPEIFQAALHMLAKFPLLGLGQGDFYRLSADPAFSQSAFLSETLNGENTHNYFLQILVENGLIGFFIFLFAIIYPVKKTVARKTLVPATVALASIFVSNIYAHSLLVRENFFMAAAFVALLYAWQCSLQQSSPSVDGKNIRLTNPQLIVLVLLVSLVGIFSLREVKRSFQKIPFTYDAQCFKNRPLAEDGWTAGIFETPLLSGSSGVQISLKDIQPGVANQPLGAVLRINDATGLTVVSDELSFRVNQPTMIEIKLPRDMTATSDIDYRVVLTLSRCFIPRNLGINADSRRLGVAIESVRMLVTGH